MMRTTGPGLVVLAAVAVASRVALGGTAPACEIREVLAPDGAAGDRFGATVSISGDIAVVGAYLDDDNGTDSGSAYVFRFNGSTWIQEQKLLAPDGAAGDAFGVSVSVSGDAIVVGAFGDNDNGTDSGSAYVFRHNGASWLEEQKIKASDGASFDIFGLGISVSGDVAVVGATFDDDNGQDSGSAYVFRYNGASWVQEQKLLASDGAAADRFGNSSISDDVIVIGAFQHDHNGTNSGSAYVFRYNGATWVQEQELLAPDGAAGDLLGSAVSASGDALVVTAEADDDNGTDSGSAYVFRHNGATWVQEQKLLPLDGAAGDHFGRDGSMSGVIVGVGAHRNSDNGVDSGSTYAFRYNGSTWIQEPTLLASDGAAGDLFGGAVSVSDDALVAAAEAHDDNGTESGSAYLFAGVTGADCDGDGAADLCEIVSGSAEDADGDLVPDDCECLWDTDGDDVVGILDFLDVLGAWGPNPGHRADLDADGEVGILDFLLLLGHWGPCPRLPINAT